MKLISLKTLPIAMALILLGDPAHALRCGSKLVKDGMLESQVTAMCGEPVSVRLIGSVIRFYDPYEDRRGLARYNYYLGYGAQREMLVTEMLFNFGPHKLMRRMRFEGGRLVSIETAGYGYREKS